ncbi:MAG: TfoX/Sxy family protein [Gemmatimonadales bacterium]
MSSVPSPADLLEASLLGLRGVSSKRLFGDQAFFVAGRMFAFRRDGALVLKLPEVERREVLGAGHGKPFLVGDSVPFGRWVEVRLKDLRTAIGLALIAHAAARVPDRAGPRKRRRTHSSTGARTHDGPNPR